MATKSTKVDNGKGGYTETYANGGFGGGLNGTQSWSDGKTSINGLSSSQKSAIMGSGGGGSTGHYRADHFTIDPYGNPISDSQKYLLSQNGIGYYHSSGVGADGRAFTRNYDYDGKSYYDYDLNRARVGGGMISDLPPETPKATAMPSATTSSISKPSPINATPSAPTMNQAPASSTPSAPAFDQSAYLQKMQDGVNSIYDNQKQAQLAQLYASRDKAVGQLNQQKAEVAPQYADKRNQSDVVSNQNVQRLHEIMANSGLTSSGENVTASVGLQNARQSALNGLNLQEQQTMNDFNRQISDLNNPADEQALIAALEAQRSQALYDANNRADDRSYQVGRDNVGDNQWNQQFNQSQYVDGRNFNYQAGRDNVADSQWNKQFDYGAAVDNRNFNYQVGRDNVGDSQWNQQFNYGQSQDTIQNAMNEAGITGKYNGKDTLAALDAARNFALNQAGVTGKYNGQNTMANNQLIAQLTGKYNGKDTYQTQQDAINNDMAQAGLTGKYNGKDTYQAQRDKVGDNQWNKSFNEQTRVTDREYARRVYEYNNMSAVQQKQFDQASQQFGENMAWQYWDANKKAATDIANNQTTADALKNADVSNYQDGGGNFTRKAKGSPTKTFNSQMSQAVQTGGVPSSWVPALTELVGRESSWNSGAKNPKSTAHGYAQFLNSTESKYEKEMGLDYNNPTHQLIMMAKYVQDRYGTPEKALAFWDKNNWY